MQAPPPSTGSATCLTRGLDAWTGSFGFLSFSPFLLSWDTLLLRYGSNGGRNRCFILIFIINLLLKVITTLKTTAHPVENIPFPTVTICGSGLHMDNVKKAVTNNFAKWREENERRRTGKDEIVEDMAVYMDRAA